MNRIVVLTDKLGLGFFLCCCCVQVAAICAVSNLNLRSSSYFKLFFINYLGFVNFQNLEKGDIFAFFP